MFNIAFADISAAKNSSLLWETLNGNRDGFVLHSALTRQTVDKILSNLHLIPENQKLHLPNSEGYTFPVPYSIITSSELIEKYFNCAGSFADLFQQLSDLNIFKFLEGIFSHLSDGRTISSLHTSEKLPFAPANIRLLSPGKGGLNIHCENSFLHQLSPDFMNYFKRVDIYNQLSFLFVLRKAESAGEVELYDVEWNEAPIKTEDFDNDVLKNDVSLFFRKKGFSGVNSTVIELLPGDLFVFRSGQIWHRVRDVQGTLARITMGGFLGRSVKDNCIFYWA